MLNILKEPLIRIATSHSTRWASLPEVYDALMADEVDAFPALRPHQRHAWHAFLSQLAAMAMYRAGVTVPPEDAAEWVGLLRGLTPDWPDDEPWHLVRNDITEPAFMQPPALSPAEEKEYRSAVATPDELDMLVTSKNHDLKKAVAIRSRSDNWILALVAVQTMGGYSAAGKGAQYHTVSRVNGATSSRVAFSLTPSVRLGRHVRRDVLALLEKRSALLKDFKKIFADFGKGLIWIEPWDGTKAMDISKKGSKLDPFYIEVCRRIRLTHNQESGRILGKRVGSKSARMNAKDLKGQVGDPWMPIKQSGKAAGALRLTKEDGLGYKQIARCLDPSDYALPPIFMTESEQQSPTDMFLVARGIVSYTKAGGGTETRGFEEQVIPLRLKTVQIFGKAPEGQRLGDISKSRIDQIKEVHECLKDAIVTLIAGEDIEKMERRKRTDLRKRDEIQTWLNSLDEMIENDFFEHLQTEFLADPSQRDSIRRAWLLNCGGGVITRARKILCESESSLPFPAIQRYRNRITADRVFDRTLQIRLSSLFDKQEKEDKEC